MKHRVTIAISKLMKDFKVIQENVFDSKYQKG